MVRIERVGEEGRSSAASYKNLRRDVIYGDW